MVFPSPHSGILFLLAGGNTFLKSLTTFPSPHSGILFLSEITDDIRQLIEEVGFRPLIRGFFFYDYFETTHRDSFPVSVPSFGDSFFISYCDNAFSITRSERFRPLIRGFFFYKHMSRMTWTPCGQRFRPLIRGFFFYYRLW